MNDEATFLKALAGGADDTTRLAYADWLEERGDPRAAWVRDPAIFRWMGSEAGDPVPGLIKGLREANWHQGTEIIAILRRIGAPAVPALVDLIAQGSEAASWAGMALAGMERDAVEPVLPCLFELVRHPSEEIHGPAIDALRAVGSAAAPAIPDLIRVLSGGRDDSHVAERAVDVLAGLGPLALDAVPALLLQLHYPETDADSALLQIGPAAAPIILQTIPNLDRESFLRAATPLEGYGEVVEPLLREALGSGNDRVRLVAALALAARDPQAALPVLVEALQQRNYGSYSDELHIAETILRMGQDAAPAAEALGQLLPELGEGRSAIVQVLEVIGAGASAAMGLIEQLRSDSPAERYAALSVLEGINELPRDAVAAALPLLRDREASLRSAALRVTARCVASGRFPDLVQPALLACLRHGNVVFLQEVLPVITRFMDEEVGQDVLRGLLHDRRAQIRLRAVQLLAERGYPGLGEELLRLAQDPVAKVRSAAIKILGETSPISEAIAAVVRSAIGDRNAKVRLAGLHAAAKRSPQAFAAEAEVLTVAAMAGNAAARQAAVDLVPHCGMPVREAVAVLVRCLADRHAQVKGAALYRLAELLTADEGKEAVRGAIPMLVRLLSSDHFLLGEGVVRVLGRLGTFGVPRLVTALRHPAEVVRRRAAIALGETGADGLVDSIAPLLRDPVEGVREAAATALGRLGPASVTVAPLCRALRDGAAEVRQAALTALGRLGDAASETFPDVAALLGDVTESVVATALWAGCRIGTADQKMTLLQEASRSPSDRVRQVARVESYRLGKGEVPDMDDLLVAGFLSVLHDDLEELLVATAQGRPEAVAKVCQGLDRYGQEVALAARVLAHIGQANPEPATQGLIRVLQFCGATDLWRAALRALSQLGQNIRAVFPQLRWALEHYDPDVRALVAVAFRRFFSDH